MRLPRRLAAPAPGWMAETGVGIVGAGITGPTTALRLTYRLARFSAPHRAGWGR